MTAAPGNQGAAAAAGSGRNRLVALVLAGFAAFMFLGSILFVASRH